MSLTAHTGVEREPIGLSLPLQSGIRSVQWPDGADHKGLSALLRADGDPVADGTAQDLRHCIGVFDRVEIQPGKSTQNAYIERFNRTARHKWLDLHEFNSVAHAQTQWLWLWQYNNERPNTAYLQPSWHRQDNPLLKRAVKNGGVTLSWRIGISIFREHK